MGTKKNNFLYPLIQIIGLLLMNTIVWVFTIILTFVLLEYFLNNTIIGLKSTVKEKEEKDFIISKKEAKKETIIPTEKKLQDIKIKEKKEEIIAEKIIEDKEKKQNEMIFSDYYNYGYR